MRGEHPAVAGDNAVLFVDLLASCGIMRPKRDPLVFLLYQKGRHSRIFEAQDRAIDDFTLKIKTARSTISH